MNFFTLALLSFLTLQQPSKLQLMEEAVDRVLMTHSIAYEKGNKLEGKLADITITYTGSTTIDAKHDTTTSVYYIYGSYTWAKYTYIQPPNVLQGGPNIPGKSSNTNGSTSYVARVKSVLDDYRVQEIIVISNPETFDFQTADYESMKTTSDWIYPTLVYQTKDKKKEEK